MGVSHSQQVPMALYINAMAMHMGYTMPLYMPYTLPLCIPCILPLAPAVNARLIMRTPHIYMCTYIFIDV